MAGRIGRRSAVALGAMMLLTVAPLARAADAPPVAVYPALGTSRLAPAPLPSQPLPPRPDLEGIPNLLDPKVVADLARRNVEAAKIQVNDASVVAPQSLAANQHRQPTAATALTGPASRLPPEEDPLAAPTRKPQGQ